MGGGDALPFSFYQHFSELTRVPYTRITRVFGGTPKFFFTRMRIRGSSFFFYVVTNNFTTLSQTLCKKLTHSDALWRAVTH